MPGPQTTDTSVSLSNTLLPRPKPALRLKPLSHSQDNKIVLREIRMLTVTE